MSRFFCDTNSDLWYTKVEELGVNVIEMPYSLDGEECVYDLGKTQDLKAFYEKIKLGSDVKTMGLNSQNYIDYFEPILKAGEDVIYVHFSSRMSGTFKQMEIAINELKEKYPERKITTADTKQICIGQGLLTYEAAKMWKNGASDEEIKTFVENYSKNYAMYFAVNDLSSLRKGGRLNTASFVVGTMLNLKPILHVNNDGELTKFGIAKGIKSALKEMIVKIKETGSDLNNHVVIVAHANMPELAEEFEKMLISELGDGIEIWRQPIGPVIACHCGAGTIGFAFHANVR